MTVTLVGEKIGMTQLFDKEGKTIPCTMIAITPNQVVQIKHKTKKDGYSALQIGCPNVKRKKKNIQKPQLGHFAKAQVEPSAILWESRIDGVEEYSIGQKLNVELFNPEEYVDISGTSKGKGYQGVMKKYNFAGGPAAHGSGFHRHAGSTGMRSTPGRCLPGGPRPSQMGNKKKTVQNLQVVSVNAEKNILLVRGAIPGSKGGFVFISKSIKKQPKK